MTLAHEHARYLDHQEFGLRGQFASAQLPEFQVWRVAVEKTDAFKRLRDLAGKQTDSGHAVDTKHVQYLLDIKELWARSYAQWIAEKSQDVAMARQLNKMRKPEPGLLYYPRQWARDDFAGVREALDRLFELKGWLLK